MLPTCQWFFYCRNLASKTIPHPILGAVPACDRCIEVDARLRGAEVKR